MDTIDNAQPAMMIYHDQKLTAARNLLTALGFTVSTSSNSRHDIFYEVKDKHGRYFASTLHSGELIRLAAEVLMRSTVHITSKDVLKDRSL